MVKLKDDSNIVYSPNDTAPILWFKLMRALRHVWGDTKDKSPFPYRKLTNDNIDVMIKLLTNLKRK